MRPVLGEMHRLGGSHAQQDVLEQLFLSNAALRAGLDDDARLLLERVAFGCTSCRQHRRIGDRAAAQQLWPCMTVRCGWA